MIGWHMRPLYLVQELINKTLTRRAVIRFVREIGDELNGIFLLALADSLAAQGKEKPKDLEDRLKDLWRNSPSSPEMKSSVLWKESPPLISGRDLIELGMKPGPVIQDRALRNSGRTTGRENFRPGTGPGVGQKKIRPQMIDV